MELKELVKTVCVARANKLINTTNVAREMVKRDTPWHWNELTMSGEELLALDNTAARIKAVGDMIGVEDLDCGTIDYMPEIQADTPQGWTLESPAMFGGQGYYLVNEARDTRVYEVAVQFTKIDAMSQYTPDQLREIQESTRTLANRVKALKEQSELFAREIGIIRNAIDRLGNIEKLGYGMYGGFLQYINTIEFESSVRINDFMDGRIKHTVRSLVKDPDNAYVWNDGSTVIELPDDKVFKAITENKCTVLA